MQNIYQITLDNLGNRALLIAATSPEIAIRKTRRKIKELVTSGEIYPSAAIDAIRDLGTLDAA